MSTLLHTAIAVSALLVMASAASRTFISVPSSGSIDVDKIFEQIERRSQ